MLKDENTDLKEETQVTGRLAECNPVKTIAQWLSSKKKSFSVFSVPSEKEDRILFCRAYEQYAKWLNDITAEKTYAHTGYSFLFDRRKHGFVMSWELVCRINSGEIADVPEAYDLLKYLR